MNHEAQAGAAPVADAEPAASAASASASAATVRLRGLHAAAAPNARQAVLHGIDLDLVSGEQVAVIGASGSGKTTLLQALGCAIAPRQGELRLFGVDPWTLSSAARQRLRGRLCLVPQVPPLPPRQRVVTAVLAGRLPSQTLWQSLRTLWHPREADVAHRALAALDLADALWLRVDRLSGGERQRVGLARALVSEAALWLIDEPLSALDPVRSEMAVATLTEAARADGRTLVCSLHQVDVARRRFARIVGLRAGRVVYDGPSAGLDDARVRELYGADDPALPAAEALRAAAAALEQAPEVLCR